jgi:hypothetical protein
MNNKKYKKQRRIIYLSAYLIIIIGITISYSLNDWQWFSRAGSLLVILGIYLTSIQIIENNRRLMNRHQEMHRNGNFQRDWAKQKQEQSFFHNLEHETETWVMGKCGFNLLISGTLIWGFGDLLSLL